MRSILYAVILCTAPLFCYAQVNISALLPASGFVQKEQLWNVVLVNNGNEPLDVNIKMSVLFRSSGETILTASTGNFLLTKGVRTIRANEIQPILYNYSSTSSFSNYLPLGQYIVCYQVYDNGSRKDVPIADECIRMEVKPLTPPMLSFPEDKAVLQSLYPRFSWIPPSPIMEIGTIKYSFKLVELLKGDSPAEAIQNNIPVYFQSEIPQASLSLPPSFSELKRDKTYAWQVIVTDAKGYTDATEIWTFNVAKEDSIENIIASAPYIKLNKSTNELSFAQQGFLKVEIDNIYGDSVGSFIVRDINKPKGNNLIAEFKLKLVNGHNFLKYQINPTSKLKPKHIYELQYINSLGESFFLKFQAVIYN